jgi:hypothetical protein
MQNELRQPVQDFANELKLSARANLPNWDKMNTNQAAGIRATSSNRSGYAVKREREKARGFTQAGTADRGFIRHPLFGNRNYWYDTPVPGATGWWSRVVEDRLPVHVQEFSDAVWLVIRRLSASDLSTRTIPTGKTRTKTVL